MSIDLYIVLKFSDYMHWAPAKKDTSSNLAESMPL